MSRGSETAGALQKRLLPQLQLGSCSCCCWCCTKEVASVLLMLLLQLVLLVLFLCCHGTQVVHEGVETELHSSDVTNLS